MKIKKKLMPTKSVEVSECVICLENIEIGQTIKTMRCNHYFHASCIDRWLIYSMSKYCPTCKQENYLFPEHYDDRSQMY